jgi:hypothetical protein
MFEIPETFLNNNIQKKSERDKPEVVPFSDCIMYQKNLRGYTFCDGLTEMLCQTRGKCSFYKKGEDNVTGRE